jgi:hypothetical protein
VFACLFVLTVTLLAGGRRHRGLFDAILTPSSCGPLDTVCRSRDACVAAVVLLLTKTTLECVRLFLLGAACLILHVRLRMHALTGTGVARARLCSCEWQADALDLHVRHVLHLSFVQDCVLGECLSTARPLHGVWEQDDVCMTVHAVLHFQLRLPVNV